MSTILDNCLVLGHRPFAAGKGASLYLGHGSPDPGPGSIRYRRPRVIDGNGVQLEAFNRLKGKLVATVVDPTASFAGVDLTPYVGQIVYLDVRTHSNQEIENENEHYLPLRIALDGGGASIPQVNGNGRVVSAELRDGAVVRFTFVWRGVFGSTGEVPTDFVLRRISGPTAPADVVLVPEFGLLVQPEDTFTVDTVALTNGGTYVFHIFARTAAADETGLPGLDDGVSLDTTVIPDSDGPPAVTLTIARV